MGFLDKTGLERLWLRITNKFSNYVLSSRTINNKPLTDDITLIASDVGALPNNETIPTSLLPSYVDDVLEYSAFNSFPATGEAGKIYVDTTTNKTYRWSGSAYIEISASLALGTTSSTAYRGDYGAAAYAHAIINKGIAKNAGLYKITTNSEGHIIAATAVEKSDITALGIPAQDTTYVAATASAAGLMSAADKTRLDTLTDDYIKSLIDAKIAALPMAEEGAF